MNVVYAATRNAYEWMVPSIRSFVEHNPNGKIYIMIEDDNLPIKLPCDAEIINVADKKFFTPDNPNMQSKFTYMAMMRVLYAELFPELDKVLQLDIDTIICEDLTPLYDIDLTDKWFAACPEYNGRYNPFGKDKYYNVGVCLFNLEQMRKDNITPKLKDFLNTRKMMCLEQDALNYYGVPDKCVDIPIRYNDSWACGYTDTPAIVHFCGYKDWWINTKMPRRQYLDKYRM